LDVRKSAIEELVKPLAETLTTYQKETKALEEKRQREVGSIGEQLRSVTQAEELLRKETAKLVKEWSDKASKTGEDISKTITDLADKTLEKMNIPTRDEVEKLEKKITALSARVKKLEGASQSE
jgi:polyhydroxyalkanoate synthesis regulator phasin